jgi:hypothetical protein
MMDATKERGKKKVPVIAVGQAFSLANSFSDEFLASALAAELT